MNYSYFIYNSNMIFTVKFRLPLYDLLFTILFILLPSALQVVHTVMAFKLITSPLFHSNCRMSASTTILSTLTTLYYQPQKEKTRVILYHKPLNVVTTHATNDILGRLNVYEDIVNRCYEATFASTQPSNDSKIQAQKLPHNFPTGWHTIGRLDAATSGLLLITNNGQLVHHVTNHRSATQINNCNPLQKTYEVVAMGYFHEYSPLLEQFRCGGINIGNNQTTLPVQNIQILNHPTSTTTRLTLSIIEGRNRQIRKMFHACGSGVMKLSRIAIGGCVGDSTLSSGSVRLLTLDMVPNVGDWCYLSDETISSTLAWTTATTPLMSFGTKNNNSPPKRSKDSRGRNVTSKVTKKESGSTRRQSK